ncbi:hypothetical protein DUNSADRAFT_11012 [Dunaliella salina]|uniref:Encoded protein n=1 Tax=Dunaliella salina TaxID=3046 RepID=A0ABQ7GEC8_DUNSA|nr:hypothetical protein DUNSADRAFT_11012 [Dunaliella salina]|eukprot:KAF5832932.1 hypothetical protein DUNSADRAFT_11012 [Dunaliella salina]
MFAPMDENAGLMHHGIHDKENSSSFVVGGSRGLAGSGAGKNVLQPPSGRKALGNITNTTSKQQPGSSFGGAPEKGGKAAAPARRAFGVDITNSGALKQQQQPPGDPSSVKRKPLQALEPQQPPQTCSKQQLLPKSKAEVYAEGGVERLAGKSFREQEVDRLQREERDIDQRVKQLTSAMSMWKPQGVSAHSDFKEH